MWCPPIMTRTDFGEASRFVSVCPNDSFSCPILFLEAGLPTYQKSSAGLVTATRIDANFGCELHLKTPKAFKARGFGNEARGFSSAWVREASECLS